MPTLIRDIPDFGKCVLNTSGNLNSKYVPYESKNYGNTPAIRFDGPKFIHNVKFDEIIGIGPTKVFDEDSNEILLQIPLVDPSSKGGYSVPELFGKDLTSGSYPETTSIRPATRTTLTTKQNLYMSEKDAKKLTALFDEGEYRVYSQSKRNFKFQPSDIATIALPSSVKLDSGKGPTIDLRTLVKLIIDNKNISDGDIISALHKYGCVNETGRLSAVSEKALCIFIELMTRPYKDVGIE